MNKNMTKSILLLIILISTFSCASTIQEKTYPIGTNATNEQANANAETTEAVASNASGNAAQKSEPAAVVHDLYKTHDKDNGAILDGKSRKLLDKFFDKTLADYMWKDLTTHKDEVGVLDFDPFYNAQDVQIKNFNIGQTKIEGEKASVLVSFQNFDRKDNLTYMLVRQNSAWKISDIKYTDGTTLIGYFKEDAKNSAANNEPGNFEGTYKVGDTTCTVKPIKMAYEIKWKQGRGTMIFFADGDAPETYSFVSEDKAQGKDKFIFDDDSYTTGRFVRADGKEMPVSKVK